jgi:hypothetical protein
MGFFKKIFKGVKKVFKKVGKAIKSAFKSVGKFMGKIGIIGQIGLALVLPGIGAMLGTGLQGLGGALAGYSGIGSSVVNAAGQFITKAVEIGGRVGNFFSSVTDGVTKVVGQTVGAAANSIGITPESFLGKGLSKVGIDVGSASWEGVWKTTQEAMVNVVDAGKNIFVPTVDSATASTLTSQTAQVQEGLQTQIEGGMGTPDVPAPTMEQPSLLSPRDMAPPTGGVTSAPPTVLERIQAGSYTTDASGTIVSKADLAVPDVPQTFIDKLKGRGAELYERAKEEIVSLPETALDRAKEEIVSAPAKVIAGQVNKLAGLEPEYVTNITNVKVPALDMGSTTGIGYDLLTPDMAFQEYGQQFVDERPFGAFAGMFDYYREEMAKRGYA